MNVKTILSCLAISIAINFLEVKIDSNFTHTFLREDLLSLLLTLLAINTATAAVISSKLESLGQNYQSDFTNVYKEIKFSLIEQIWLIGLSIVLLIFGNSSLLKLQFNSIDLYVNILLLTILLYAIDILRDTGVAIFNIIIELNKTDGQEE